MTNIEKSQVFNATADQCFEGLLRALKSLHIEVPSSNVAERTVIARWSGGMGAKFTIQAQCVPEGDNATTVHIVYRRDLTPAMFRPMGGTPPAEYEQRVNLILSSLTKYLDPSADTSSITADMENMEQELSEKKRAIAKRLAVIAMLSVITGAICGLQKFLALERETRAVPTSAEGTYHIISGFSTFFVATLIAWVVYALIARAMNK